MVDVQHYEDEEREREREREDKAGDSVRHYI
jgi:hypothetical protein